MRPLSVRQITQRYHRTLIFVLLSTLLVAFGLQGFEHGRINNFSDQSIQLPIIYSYADPSLFSGDFLLQARESYVTLFYPTLGYISRAVPLDALMLGLYLLSVGLTITAVYSLAETLFPNRDIGLFAVVLWMAYLPNLGGDYIHSPFVTHSTFAISLALWAIVLIFRQKKIAAAVLLGFIANINAMTSFFVVFMWAFAVVTDRKQWSLRLLVLPVVMGVMALPILLWRFSLPLVEASLDDFVSIIRLRLWYAVFPFSISLVLWLGFFALLILWFYSFQYGKAVRHPFVLRMVGGISALCLVGTFFSEVIPLEFMIELQLIRSSWLINLFILIYIANMIREWLNIGDRHKIMLAFGLVIALAIPRWFMERIPIPHPTPYPLYVNFDTPWVDRDTPTFWVISSAVLAGLVFVVWWITHRPNTSYPRTVSRLIVGWFTVSIGVFILPAFLDSQVPSEQVQMTKSWEESLVWVEKNTPKDARFVTPPTFDGFRVSAKRPNIGDWKDGTVGIFNNGWAIEWYEVMLDLGFDEAAFAFNPLDQKQLCYVIDKYKVDYVIALLDWHIEGEAAFANDHFAVLPTKQVACPYPSTHIIG